MLAKGDGSRSSKDRARKIRTVPIQPSAAPPSATKKAKTAGKGALRRKPRCVWACGTRSGPSNAPPGLQPRSAPVTAAGQRNKTMLDLSNASKNRLKSGVSYATHTLSSMAVSASQSIASFVPSAHEQTQKRQICIKEWEKLVVWLLSSRSYLESVLESGWEPRTTNRWSLLLSSSFLVVLLLAQ